MPINRHLTTPKPEPSARFHQISVADNNEDIQQPSNESMTTPKKPPHAPELKSHSANKSSSVKNRRLKESDPKQSPLQKWPKVVIAHSSPACKLSPAQAAANLSFNRQKQATPVKKQLVSSPFCDYSDSLGAKTTAKKSDQFLKDNYTSLFQGGNQIAANAQMIPKKLGDSGLEVSSIEDPSPSTPASAVTTFTQQQNAQKQAGSAGPGLPFIYVKKAQAQSQQDNGSAEGQLTQRQQEKVYLRQV